MHVQKLIQQRNRVDNYLRDKTSLFIVNNLHGIFKSIFNLHNLYNYLSIFIKYYLKGLCHEDFAILGQVLLKS